MFEWLESTPVAIWVGESLWGYPIMLGMHVVGLSIVVGLFVMRDLRIAGVQSGISYASLESLCKIGWYGFALNAVSGLCLFSSQATYFIENRPFLIKISTIALAAVIAGAIQNQLRSNAGSWDSGNDPDAGMRALAVFSIILWLGAIVAGRLIAYL